MTVTKLEIGAALKARRPQMTESTERTYTCLLHLLQFKGDGNKQTDGIEWYTTHAKEITAIIDRYPYPASRKTNFCALYVLTGLQEYRTGMTENAAQVADDYAAQTVSTKRAKVTMSPAAVAAIVARLTAQWVRSPSHEAWTDMFIGQVMTGAAIPPRRLVDWCAFRVRNFNSKDLTQNGLVGKTAVFNNYKTAASDRRKGLTATVPLPDDLVRKINRWKKVSSSDFLLVNTKGEPFTPTALNRRVGKLFGGASVDVLRSVYLSHLYKDVPKLAHLETVAHEMGHSVQAAMEFYVKPEVAAK